MRFNNFFYLPVFNRVEDTLVPIDRKYMIRIIHSRLIRWLLVTGLFFLSLLSVLRFVFHLVFAPAGEKNVLGAFWMGLRFDARMVCVFLVIIFLSALLFFLKPFNNSISR